MSTPSFFRPTTRYSRATAPLGRRTFLALVAGSLLTLAAPAIAAGDPAPKTVRLLTVGNSFSRNATRFLGDLATANGDVLVHRPIVVGGASLELHWTKAAQHEQDAQDPRGRYANGRTLQDELLAERWDFVTIQQASIKSHDLATYRPFAGRLRDTIQRHAPSATLLMHQTWEYRCDDPRFSVATPKPGEPASADSMYRGLNDAYTTVAREIGARIIPVGDAFHLANQNAQWGYRPPPTPFDARTAQPPTRPDETHSLNIGWRWTKAKDGTQKATMDGHHASVAGEYLGACVWYEVLFGRSAQGNAFVPPGVDPAYARFLQDTAHRAVVARQSATHLPR